MHTHPIGPPDDTPPYRAGDIVMRLTDGAPLVVLRVLDWRDVPAGGWLVTADSPDTGPAQYHLDQVRPLHLADLTHPARAQRVRRLVRFHGATSPYPTEVAS